MALGHWRDRQCHWLRNHDGSSPHLEVPGRPAPKDDSRCPLERRRRGFVGLASVCKGALWIRRRSEARVLPIGSLFQHRFRQAVCVVLPFLVHHKTPISSVKSSLHFPIWVLEERLRPRDAAAVDRIIRRLAKRDYPALACSKTRLNIRAIRGTPILIPMNASSRMMLRSRPLWPRLPCTS